MPMMICPSKCFIILHILDKQCNLSCFKDVHVNIFTRKQDKNVQNVNYLYSCGAMIAIKYSNTIKLYNYLKAIGNKLYENSTK